MPCPVHDAVQTFFEQGINELSRRHALQSSERSLFRIMAGNDVNAFTGDKAGSRKRADLTITPQRPIPPPDYDDGDDDDDPLNACFPSVAVEVGYSEDYEQLLADMRLWLLASDAHVRVVVIVCLSETPIYNSKPFRCPVTTPAQPPASRWIRDGPYGPLRYDGHILVGTISGFVELWRLDATGVPHVTSRKILLPPSPPREGERDCIELSMADVFGGAERVPARLDPGESVPFDLRVYRVLIGRTMKEHGMQRLADVAGKRKREEVGDSEWVEEGERGRKRGKGEE